MENSKPLVIVLSRNYATGLSVIRSLGAAGYKVDLVASAIREGKSEIAACSKYVGNHVEVISKKVSSGKDEGVEKICEELMKYAGVHSQKPVIFPTDDYTASVMDQCRETLEPYFLMPHIVGGGAGSMVEKMDKTVQAKLAQEAGLLTPKEWIISLRKEKIQIPEDMVYPCFCKPIESVTGYKREMAKCRSRYELETHLKKLRKRHAKRDVLVQEFLTIDNEIDMSGLCLDQEIIIPAIIKKTNVAQYEKGVTLAGRVVSVDEISAVKDQVVEMLKKFRYVGMFDMELNIVGDKIYFNEVNLRSGGPNYSYFKSGINIPDLFVKAVTGVGFTKEEAQVDTLGKSFIYEKVAWEDYIHGFMTKEELDKKIADADINLLYNDDDPAPQQVFLKEILEEEEKYKEKAANQADAKEKKTTPPPVIVLSRNYATGLSVIRSLGAAGYDVDLVASAIREGKSEIAACSKYVGKHVEVISKKVSSGTDDSVKKICMELLKYADVYEEKPVIFPTDDYTASIMDMGRQKLEPYFHMPYIVDGGAGSMVERMDKTVQAKFAQEAGLLTPKEWIISLRKEKIHIPEDMVYPCFCKPIESVTGYKREMAKCETEQQLKEHLKKLRKRHADRDVLVQEFLVIDNEIDMSGLCLDQEIIIPAIIKKTNVAQYEKGVTLAGRVVSVDEISQVKDQVVEMLKKFRYVGMFDMELNIVGDKIYFNEVNLRSGGPNYSYFKSGVNIPDLFVKAVTGKIFTEEETKVDALGKSFIYEKVAWEDHIHGFMTKEELNKKIADADINLLYNDDDPAPQQVFIKEIKEEQRKQRLKQLKNKVETLLGKIKRKIRSAIRKVVRPIKLRMLGLPQLKAENQRNPQSEKPRVIISGRNYCSNLSLARSFGEAGYEVEILRIFQTKPKRDELMKKLRPDAYSKYIKAYHECITNRDEKKIRKRLLNLADPDRKMLLIPADDLVASVVDKNYNRLSEHYLMPNINGEKGAINKMMSKRVQTELAREAGLPVINSCLIKVKKRGKVKVPDTVTYPCFIKPNISKNSSKSRMKRCDSKKELVATLKQYSRKKDIEMLVEDFINIKKEYSLLGLSTKDCVVIPGFFGAEKGGHGAHRGVALVGRILPVSQQQQLIEDIKEFIGTLGYEGLFDVDLVETEEGKMYYVELNLRYGASGYAVTKCGANLPGMFADYMIFGTPVDPDCKVAVTDKTFVSEKIAIDEYVSGDITKEEMMQELAVADIRFVSNEDDPQAYKHFEKFFRIADITKEKARKAAIVAKEGSFAKRTLRKIKRKVKRILRKVKAHLLDLPQLKAENQRNPQSEKPRVIISGRNYCSNLSLARSFGEAGYEVEVLRIFQTKPKLANVMKILKPDAYSKYIKAYHVCITNRDENKLKKRLIKLADPDRKLLLIPADDLVASIVDKNYKRLSQHYFIPNINEKKGAINKMMSKRVQTELAREAGLPVINSCLIKVKKRGKVEIPETVTYPCFVKPNISKNSSKSKMKRCDSREELEQLLKSYSRSKEISMLVEDFIDIKKEYSLLGLSTKDCVVIPGFFGAEKGGHAERRGVAMVGRILPVSQQQQLIDDIKAFIGTIGYEGLFDVDLVETQDGKMYFVELNLRYGASGYAVTKCGANLPGMFADYMVFGTPVDPDCKVDVTDKTFISEKIMLDEYLHGFITKAEMEKEMAQADIHFVSNDEDTKPYSHFKKFYTVAAVMKNYYKNH